MFSTSNCCPEVRLTCVLWSSAPWRGLPSLPSPAVCLPCSALFTFSPVTENTEPSSVPSLLGCFHFSHWSHSHLPALPDTTAAINAPFPTPQVGSGVYNNKLHYSSIPHVWHTLEKWVPTLWHSRMYLIRVVKWLLIRNFKFLLSGIGHFGEEEGWHGPTKGVKLLKVSVQCLEHQEAPQAWLQNSITPAQTSPHPASSAGECSLCTCEHLLNLVSPHIATDWLHNYVGQ